MYFVRITIFAVLQNTLVYINAYINECNSGSTGPMVIAPIHPIVIISFVARPASPAELMLLNPSLRRPHLKTYREIYHLGRQTSKKKNYQALLLAILVVDLYICLPGQISIIC